MGGKKKSKASATTTETFYEVVDEPDTAASFAAPMATSLQAPTAAAVYPTATAAPLASAYPMASAY